MTRPPTIDDVRSFIGADHGLATVSVARRDGSVHSTVVNAGVLLHPVTGQHSLGLVARGSTVKLVHWRRDPRATLIVRAGWRWVGVEGPVMLFGPADPVDGLSADVLPGVLRDIFTAAGGTHDDWEEYDRVMAAEARTAVFITPDRIRGTI